MFRQGHRDRSRQGAGSSSPPESPPIRAAAKHSSHRKCISLGFFRLGQKRRFSTTRSYLNSRQARATVHNTQAAISFQEDRSAAVSKRLRSPCPESTSLARSQRWLCNLAVDDFITEVGCDLEHHTSVRFWHRVTPWPRICVSAPCYRSVPQKQSG